MTAPSDSDVAPVALDRQLARLGEAAPRWSRFGLAQRAELLRRLVATVWQARHEWVVQSCRIKQVEPGSAAAAEEAATGPMATLRYLQVLARAMDDCMRYGRPCLPQRLDRRRAVATVFPTRQLYDRLLFRPFRIEVWLDPPSSGDAADAGAWQLSGDALTALPPGVCVVLGAGNVAAIPVTDTLHKLFCEGQVVLLKMNPVNAGMAPVFRAALEPLIEAGWLEVVCGGAEVGAAAIAHPNANSVHITGSLQSHQTIVWGPPGAERQRRLQTMQPLLDKPITSELGNVTPWIVVPGRYSRRQLQAQVQNTAAMIVNNASFNCIALKTIVTCRQWPQRESFLNQLQALLDATAPRSAWYPGARERFAQFAGFDPPDRADGSLPWTLLRDVTPQSNPRCFAEESFVCVTAETALDADTPELFLDAAVALANEQLWGTLGAGLMVPRGFPQSKLLAAIQQLDYGTVGVNHWPALSYALMTAPWGGAPGGTLAAPRSGIGWVHNPYLLRGIRKSVLFGPLVVRPKPVWYPSHRWPSVTVDRVVDLYARPTISNLLRTVPSALSG